MSSNHPWNLSFDDRVVLVTGAGRGLGRACTEAFALSGAHVIAVARSEDELRTLEEGHPGTVETWTEDVTQEPFYERVESLSRLHVLINNAGMNRPQPFTEVDAETLASMLELNVLAAFRTAQAATRVMLETGGGAIVNMSSQMGHVGSPNRTVYCMTKHAIEGLTKAMAVELGPRGVRVNALAPTFIETPMTRPMLDDPGFRRFVERMIPMGKVGQPSDVAAAALYLASDASAMVTGHSLRVDGGWTAA